MAIAGHPRVSSTTRDRVLQACAELGYRTPRQRRGEDSGFGSEGVAAGRVGLALLGQTLLNPVNTEWFSHLSGQLKTQRRQLEVFQLAGESEGQHAGPLAREIAELSTDCCGVLLSGSRVSRALLRELEQLEVRFVLLGWPLNDHAPHRPHCGVVVAGDDQTMGRQATAALLHGGAGAARGALGEVGFIAEAMPAGCSHSRWLEGYRLAHRDAGGRVDETLIHVVGTEHRQLPAAVTALLDRPRPARRFVVTDIPAAAQLMRLLEQRGLTLGADDLAVWGEANRAQRYGLQAATLHYLDPRAFIDAALTHVLAPVGHGLPSGSVVLTPTRCERFTSSSSPRA